MSEKFQNKYRISSTRLQNWDYGWNAAYFVTICTKNREHHFGIIDNGKMILNDIGIMAEKYWMEIPNHFPFIELGESVVMPNHVHGIVIIKKNDLNQNHKTDNTVDSDGHPDTHIVETRHCLVSTNANTNANAPTNKTKTIGQQRFQNQGKNTISSIIGSFKSAVTKNAHTICSDFAWQPRFHDHIIRNSESFQRISKYIQNNPLNWRDDTFHHKPL